MKTTPQLLLLQPPIQDFYDTTIRLQPIGLCYLKAAVQKFLSEFQVVVKDYHQGWGRRTIPLPGELAYLRKYYAYPDKSPFSSFYHYYHFGASFEELAEDVAQEQPDVVGISALFSPYYREVLECARSIKQRLDAPIIVGGSHVSADPEGMLRHEWIDFVIRGEGERPLVEFLKAWQQQSGYAHVPNLGFKQDGKIVLNPLAPNYEIEEIPVPDFSDFAPERYLFEQRPLCFLLTSRGCPYRCAFCSVHLTFGHVYRKRSVDSIFQEILQRYEQGYRVFDFEDDNLTFDADAMQQLCERLITHFPEGAIECLAMNGLSYLDLNPELLRLMKRAGFSHLNLSLVTADTATRNALQRPHSLEKYHEIVCAAVGLGFPIVSYQIVGLPGESLEAMIRTLVINTELPVLLGASIFYVTPGSPISAEFFPLTATDVLKARSTAMAVETEQVSRGDLFTLFVISRILNFLKGLPLPNSKESLRLSEALRYAEQFGGRIALGAMVLRKLFQEHSLHAVVGRELKPLRQFKLDLFLRVWSQLHHICTQHGNRLILDVGK